MLIISYNPVLKLAEATLSEGERLTVPQTLRLLTFVDKTAPGVDKTTVAVAVCAAGAVRYYELEAPAYPVRAIVRVRAEQVQEAECVRIS